MKITVCGSIAFYSEMQTVEKQLIELGHEVKIPELGKESPKEFGGGKVTYFGGYIEEKGGIDSFGPDHEIWDLKQSAIDDHFKKMEWADAILIINYEKKGFEGYVGGNTLIEMGVGYYMKKPLYLLHSVSSELSYKVEILSMKPVILDGDLSRIK